MKKLEFLKSLENALYGLPQDDIQKSLEFYSEMIDDKIEDGLSEEDAVSQIGNIDNIAKQILSDIPITKLVKQKIKPRGRISALEIVLLILGSPIWLSLIIAILAVVFSIYVALWSVIISLYVAAFSLIVSGIACVVVFPIVAGIMDNMAQGVFIAGTGLVCVGVSIFLFMMTKYVFKGLLWLSRKIWFSIKRCFIKKEDRNENC